MGEGNDVENLEGQEGAPKDISKPKRAYNLIEEILKYKLEKEQKDGMEKR